MYKSKLQELCQKQKWALPKYTCIQDGEDHCPQFKASVMLCGATFDTPTACKSSKHAYNEAAKVAFLHFTSDQFKKKLETYVQRKNLDFPVYTTEKDGIHFRGKVVICENVFRSEELFVTVEEAENAAAQAALLSLLTNAFHENDPRSYKNLLQELTQTEGFLLPTYTTIETNEAHVRIFSSTVKVQGEAFQGDTAKSKKLAELNAAKAAYTVFVERKLFEPGNIPKRTSRDEVPNLTPVLGSLTISDHQKNPKSEMKSFLLCKRFKVFTYMPNTPLPDGLVVLPISENRWTIVSLEFPREKNV